jgi:class 3 adenylate cyclase/tetratricopeptide (TPR) repeat protein
LEFICPECGKANPPGSKFCNECAHTLTPPSEPALKDLSFDEKLEKIQKYLPKGLTEKILSQKDRIQGERKQVTVMFADMEGFTGLSEKIDPEETYTIMDQVYEILIHKVHDYEGTVNEFTGDGIMALFGAPIALEDAPQRGVRSAYAIHREMTRFREKMKQEKQNIPPIKMRIGIHTGPVVVGTIGNDLRVEFKAVGDTVNLASRMEGLAVSGSTYVSEQTFKLTEGLFRYEALGEHAVKGKADPVKAYRVIAPSTSRTRFDVSAERGLTPFVGRERELELLLDGFKRSKAGRGQAFSIVAEAGVGKSRLLYEFRKAVSSEDVTFQEGKCLSYSRGVSYHPLIDIVKSNFDIIAGDGDVKIKEKLKRGLHVLDADEASTLPYLMELLSAKDSGVDPIALRPEARKDRIIKAIIRITIKASQIRPLIVATEDLHWIDSSSEDYFKELLDSISGAKVFLIFTYRPEFVHTWGAKSYHSQVTLNRIANRESLSMVSHLLGTEEIDRQLEELILEKTEGVPFYIEEFIKSLKDLKIIERIKTAYHLAKDLQAVAIPSTIQDVIMARVDSLSNGAKELLQLGSVIEREFSYELINKVSELSEKELLSLLSMLKDAEVVFERGIYPESTYIFKHALTQEVVYDSILTRKKRQLHKEIGNAIEELHKDNIEEHYGILSEHFVNGENFEKGAEYCRLAAKKAEKAASFPEAIAYGKKRIVCLEKLSQTEDIKKKIIDARVLLGLYYNQLNHDVEAKKAVDPIVDLAIDLDYKRRVSQIYTLLGVYNMHHKEDIDKTFKYLENALKIADGINDNLSYFMAHYWLGVAGYYNCEFDKSLLHFEEALEINRATNTLWGEAISKGHIGFMVYDWQGKIDLGYQTCAEALRMAEESGDIISKAVVYTCYGFSCYCKGFFIEAEKHLLKAIDFCDRINLTIWNAIAHWFLGDTYFDIDEYKKPQEHHEKAISLLESSQILSSAITLNELAIIRSKLRNQEEYNDLSSLYSNKNKILKKNWASWMYRYMTDILLGINGQFYSEAQDFIKKAIYEDEKYGMMWFLAKDYALYAKLFKRKDDLPKAKINLSKAIEISKECGADGWVEKYEKELVSLL